MPTPFTLGAQNADAVARVAASVPFTTTEDPVVIAHGLTVAPDFVLVTIDNGELAPTITTDATNITVTRGATAVEGVASVLAGNAPA